MVPISPKNGSCLIVNPLSPSSATDDSSGTSANPMVGCTSIATLALPEQILLVTSVGMVLFGTTLMVLPTFSPWLNYASNSMSPMTVPSRMNLWCISLMGAPSDSYSRTDDSSISTRQQREPHLSPR